MDFWRKLNDDREKMSALAAIYDSGGFQVILDVIEQICNETENDFIATEPWHPSVPAKHAVMHAQRKIFIQSADKIDYLVAQFRSSEKKDTASKRATSIK